MKYSKKSNGILLTSDPSKQEIAEAIYNLIILNEDERSRMEHAAYKIWEERFDATKNARKFCEYLESFNEDKNRKVVLVTNGYPFGGEKSFIENELVEIYSRFDVIIIAMIQDEISDERFQKCDEAIERVKRLSGRKNGAIEAVIFDMRWSLLKCVRYIPCYFLDKRIFKEKRVLKSYKKNKFFVQWESIKYYSKAISFMKQLKSVEDKSFGNAIFYTYWHLFSTLGICLSKKDFPDSKIITREHGYDLYDERFEKTNRQPFREVMEEYLDGIFFACEYGKIYYLNRNHVEDSNKYQISYLGTKKPLKKETKKEEGVFRILSCSNLIQLKRVGNIIDALEVIGEKRLKTKIEWIHFGGGLLQDYLEKEANQKLSIYENITYKFMGAVDNEIVHEYYSSHKVDCFITTSSTEGGTPVSIQEAMSYGIVIIGTDVGGIKEAFDENI